MNRRQTRYWLFRIQTEQNGGTLAEGVPDGLKESYENDSFFRIVGGWKGFCRTWDVAETEPFLLKPIKVDMWQDWEDHCASVAKEVPKAVQEILKVKRQPFKKKAIVEAVMKFS